MIRPGDPVPPDIEEADLLAAIIIGEPVLILLPRWGVTTIREDGTLAAADAFAAAIHAHGASPLTDLPFTGEPVTDWTATIDTTTGARITGPGAVGEVYTGSLPPATGEWLAQAADNQQHGHGIVVITGTANPTPDAALDMIAEGHASWVRASVRLHTGPDTHRAQPNSTPPPRRSELP